MRWHADRAWWRRRTVAAIGTALAVAFPIVWVGGAGSALDSVGPVPFLAGGAAVVVLIAVVLGRLPEKKTPDWRAFAVAHGWTHHPEDPALADRWRDDPFDVGGRRTAKGVVVGQLDGLPVALFTYSFVTSRNGQTRTWELGVATVAAPWSLPRLDVAPQHLVGTFAPGLAGDTVHVEDEDFNRFYRVRSDSPRYAVDILNSRALEQLLQVEPFRWRIDGSDVVTWSADTNPEELLQRLRILVGIAQHVPRHVVADRAAGRRVTADDREMRRVE